MSKYLQSIVHIYKASVRRYGYRRIRDVYKRYSSIKYKAELEILTEMAALHGYGYTIMSYNSFQFTAGYVYWKDEVLYFVYHTRYQRIEFKVFSRHENYEGEWFYGND